MSVTLKPLVDASFLAQATPAKPPPTTTTWVMAVHELRRGRRAVPASRGGAVSRSIARRSASEVGGGVGDVADSLGELGLEDRIVVPGRDVETCRAEGVLEDGAHELVDALAGVGGTQAALDRLWIGQRTPGAQTR